MPKKEPLNVFSKQSIQREISRRNRQPGPGDKIDQWLDRMVSYVVSYLQTELHVLSVKLRSLFVSNRKTDNHLGGQRADEKQDTKPSSRVL